jgi:hypothetical protein
MRLHLLISLLLAGCSGSVGSKSIIDAGADLSKISYSLYVNRGSLAAQEFEQYKALPQGLFMECGTVYRGRSQVAQQVIESPSSQQQEAIKAAANEIFQELTSEGEHHFDSPGMGSGIGDPGKYTLTVMNGVNKAEVRTSFDWVERKSTVLSSKLNSFTQSLRGALSKPPCGNVEFYGVGRAS